MKLFLFSHWALLVALVGCTKSGGPVASLGPKEVEGLLRNDFAVLVDVREQDEVAEGMAAPAKWMPLSKIESDNPEWKQFVADLSKKKQIVFYCRSGGRAGKVAEMLSKLGYKTANMGGFDDWKDAGLPVKKP